MNFIKNNKSLFIVDLFIILIMISNFVFGMIGMNNKQTQSISGFSLWQYCLVYNLGTLLIVLGPQLIAIAVVLPLYNKIKTGFLENVIIRTNYRKYFRKEIIFAYLKALLIFPLISILLIIIGLIIFGNNSNYNGSLLTYFSSNNPIKFVILTTISMVFYSFIAINLTLILSRFINKFYLVMIALFLSVFFIGFIESNFLYPIIAIITGGKVNIAVSYFDLYFVTLNEFKWSEVFIMGIIKTIITFIPIYYIYRDKESLVLKNEE